MSAVAARLKEERVRLGLNQDAMAAAAGLKRNAQINYEKGDRSPDSDYLIAVAGLGVDVGYVLTGRHSNAPTAETLFSNRINDVSGVYGVETSAVYRKLVITEGAAERLRDERKRLGMSQSDFAASAGVSRGSQVAYETGTTFPDVAYLARIERNGVDVGFVLSGHVGIGMPAGYLNVPRIPEFTRYDVPESLLLPDFVLRRKIGLTPLEHVRWVLNPSQAMEPQIDQYAVVLIDVSKAGHDAVVDGVTYAYLLSGRPDVRRILIRNDHWSVAGPGKGAEYRDVYLSDLPELLVLGAVIGVL